MSGIIIWEGKSQLDGKDIVLIATESKNVKTGPMIQTWILKANKNPLKAVADGSDSTICGDCKHRGTTCYVAVFQAPNNIYKGYQAGRYTKPKDPYKFFENQLVRIGAYGDPTAVPLNIWDKVIARSSGWTGYTHQWSRKKFLPFSKYCMASVDTIEEFDRARVLNWRTFRIKNKDDIRFASEIVCPASNESSAGLTCETCLFCDGHRGVGKVLRGKLGQNAIRKNVVINVHGVAHKVTKFQEYGKLPQLPLLHQDGQGRIELPLV